MLWACLTALLIVFYIFIGWLGARIATTALPPRDLRTRPSDNDIEAAEELLEISLPATDQEIRAACRSFYSRCIGDTFKDGTPRYLRTHEFIKAADLLVAVNAFDANPPLEARYYVAYWEHRAGVLGRLWGAMFPPKILSQLRTESAIQA